MIKSPDFFFYLIVGISIFDFAFGRWLTHLNSKSNKGELPNELKDTFDESKYKETQDYEQVNTSFGVISGTFSFLLILLMLLFGGFGIVDEWVRGITEHPILMALLFFAILGLASDVLSLPFELYQTFVIEERFGFNKTTPSIFVVDKIKGYILGGILGGGLIALFVWFYYSTGALFWLYAWVAFSAFTIFFTMFYASVVVPLFNKLTPLEEGELRTSIEAYCKEVNFTLDNIFVIDGSKRSTKSNAYFSGLGAKKKIVLYDTLIEQQTVEELTAVLAHEIGHYKKKHIPVSMTISIAQMGMMLYILSLFIGNPNLSQALGAEKASFHIGFIAFGMLYTPISMILGIGMNILSRKNEFEADNYAATTYKGEALQSALKKLSVSNLSNLRPHPLYVFFNYSHPPLVERLKAINR